MDIFVEEMVTMVTTNMCSGWLFLAFVVMENFSSVLATTHKWRRLNNTLALLTRLVSEREFNLRDEGTQVLTKMRSDSLSVASLIQEVSLLYITLHYKD